MKNKRKFGLVEVFKLIKAGKGPAQISKELKIPKTTLAYHVDKLKKEGYIEKKGYGTWIVIEDFKEVRERPKGSITGQPSKLRTSPKKEIRGHAYIWKIDFFGYYFDWLQIVKNYKKRYSRPKLTFQFISNGKVARTIYNNRKVWLTKTGMVIYEPLDFIGPSSFQVKGTAVLEMDNIVKGILKDLKQPFKPYRFTTSREHYAQMKNALARQHNERREKLIIKNEEGTTWLWIDNSIVEGFRPGELETNEAITSRQVQNFWNDNKKHNFEVTPTSILNNFNTAADQIKQNAANLDYHAENMRSHVKAVQELGAGVEKQNKLFEEIKEVLRSFKK